MTKWSEKQGRILFENSPPPLGGITSRKRKDFKKRGEGEGKFRREEEKGKEKREGEREGAKRNG